ncbi:MAG TPA: hypothetical protein VK966_05105 [Longimicrobiales bacterium]|nr:hypothetical protein [Longimicrobiales bacterium]
MMVLLSSGGTRLLGFGLLVATFLVGALAGAAVDRVLSAEDGASARTEEAEERRSYVIDEVDMSAEQRATIDAILERRSDRMRAIWRESAPRLSAITDSARSEIMDVLTPEQRAEYERRLEKRRERRDDRDDRREDGKKDEDVDEADSAAEAGAAPTGSDGSR